MTGPSSDDWLNAPEAPRIVVIGHDPPRTRSRQQLIAAAGEKAAILSIPQAVCPNKTRDSASCWKNGLSRALAILKQQQRTSYAFRYRSLTAVLRSARCDLNSRISLRRLVLTDASVADKLTDATSNVYQQLAKTKDGTLSRQEILAIIGEELEPYYTNVVQALAVLKLVVRNKGFYGGISLSGIGDEPAPELDDEHKQRLRNQFSGETLKPTAKVKEAKTEAEEEKLEKQFYEPLKNYLEQSGLYNLVVVPKVTGQKWQNADLAGVSFERDLRYHSHIDLRITAFEVKRHFPGVENMQQAASYLLYAHASYLCYFDSQFKGTNIDSVVQRLRDEGVWDLAETFGIGLIVAYYAQETAKKLYFQTVRHVPYRECPPAQAERGIDLWLDANAKTAIKKAYVKQIQRLQSGLD